jgi:hypothetical protein
MQVVLVVLCISGALIFLLKRFVPMRKAKKQSGCEKCAVK